MPLHMQLLIPLQILIHTNIRLLQLIATKAHIPLRIRLLTQLLIPRLLVILISINTRALTLRPIPLRTLLLL